MQRQKPEFECDRLYRCHQRFWSDNGGFEARVAWQRFVVGLFFRQVSHFSSALVEAEAMARKVFDFQVKKVGAHCLQFSGNFLSGKDEALDQAWPQVLVHDLQGNWRCSNSWISPFPASRREIDCEGKDDFRSFICFNPSPPNPSPTPSQPQPPTPFFEVNLLGERSWPNFHEISNIWVRFPLCPNTSENLLRKILFPFSSFLILGRLVNFIIRHEEHFVSQNLKCPTRRAHCSLFWGGLLPPPQPQTYFDSRQPWLCSPRRHWKTAWSASRQPQISMLWRIAILLWNRSWKMPKSRRMCSSNSGLFSTRTRFYVPTRHLCRFRSWYASTRWKTKTRLLANFLQGKHYVNPAAFCGLHFFNPVLVMQLVEVIRTKETSDRTYKAAAKFAKACLRKSSDMHCIPVICTASWQKGCDMWGYPWVHRQPLACALSDTGLLGNTGTHMSTLFQACLMLDRQQGAALFYRKDMSLICKTLSASFSFEVFFRSKDFLREREYPPGHFVIKFLPKNPVPPNLNLNSRNHHSALISEMPHILTSTKLWSWAQVIEYILFLTIKIRMCPGMPQGPFQLADFVGLDTCQAILKGWVEKYPEEKIFTLPKTLTQKVSEGKLGRKTGEGFWKWDGDKIIEWNDDPKWPDCFPFERPAEVSSLAVRFDLLNHAWPLFVSNVAVLLSIFDLCRFWTGEFGQLYNFSYLIQWSCEVLFHWEARPYQVSGESQLSSWTRCICVMFCFSGHRSGRFGYVLE